MTSEDPSAGAESLGGQTDIPPLGLLDLPALWLGQLVTEVEPQQRLALFRCCRALRDLVLSQHTLAVDFVLPLGPEAAPAARRLVLACQRSSRIKLILLGDSSAPAASRTASAISVNAGNLMFSAMAASGQGLSSIQSVEMHELELDALVPHWLTFTCPSMATLHVESCCFFGKPAPNVYISNFPPPTVAIPSCSQLKELHLIHLSLSDRPLDHIEAQWQHQFRALTGLNSLHCQSVPPLLQYSSCIGGQITHLTTDAYYTPGQQQVPSWFPNLSALHLLNAQLGDELMEGLLGMQHLTQLSCHGFSLQHSFCHRPCCWRQLSFSYLHYPSFDRLPLGVMRSLRAVPVHGRFYIGPGGDLETITRVASVIAACGGLKCDWGKTPGDDSALIVSNDQWLPDEDAPPDHACLVACLPLAATWQPPAFDLFRVNGITLDLLAVINRHLPSTVQCMEFSQSTFEPGVLPAVLPNLPPGVNQLKLTDMEAFSEAELTEVCVSATRSMTLVVESGDMDGQRWGEGWQQRVQAAMAAAGHQHVTLDDGNAPMGTDSQSEDGSEDEGEGGDGEAGGDEDDV